MLYLPLPDGAYRLTQPFGGNAAYYKKYGLKGHNGLDLAPKVQTARDVIVYAPHEGYVTVGDEGASGYGLFLDILGEPYDVSGTRRKSTLGHLARFLVKPGQYVGSGDPVAVMGNTGDSTGRHLHWTYKKANRAGATLDKANGYLGAIGRAAVGPAVGRGPARLTLRGAGLSVS
jgi:murein DD-endopeptidase MepM/ murein hydrolase activator NlpD